MSDPRYLRDFGGTRLRPRPDQLVGDSALARILRHALRLESPDQTLAIGGSADPDLAGGVGVSLGGLPGQTLELGGALERERAGGLALSASISLGVGGARERERAGRFAVSIVVGQQTLELGGVAEREVYGGVAAYVASEFEGRRFEIAATLRVLNVASARRESIIAAAERDYLVPGSSRG